MAWLPSPGDELIPVLLAPDDLRDVVHAVAGTAEKWAQAAAAANPGADRPDAIVGSGPGRINVEPTPAGIARLARQQQTRYTRLLERLRPIIEAADILDDAGHVPTTAAVSCAVLIGVSAAFTPADLEVLVITAAEAVHGPPEQLSSRQRELAARAWDLLHDSNND